MAVLRAFPWILLLANVAAQDFGLSYEVVRHSDPRRLLEALEEQHGHDPVARRALEVSRRLFDFAGLTDSIGGAAKWCQDTVNQVSNKVVGVQEAAALIQNANTYIGEGSQLTSQAWNSMLELGTKMTGVYQGVQLSSFGRNRPRFQAIGTRLWKLPDCRQCLVQHLGSAFEVDKISFSSTSSSLGSCKLWIDALALLDAMASLALTPHDAMYNSLAGSLENSQRWSLASALLEEMIGRRDPISYGLVLTRLSESMGCWARVAINRKALVKGCVATQDSRRAMGRVEDADRVIRDGWIWIM
eukprot:Skav209180  [mRNA]  locus=scaffold1137:529968:541792:- [translate_table: standard]